MCHCTAHQQDNPYSRTHTVDFHYETYGEIICLRHCWEGEMGSSQHKSPHQAWAFKRGLDVVTSDVVTSDEISPSRRTNDAVCIIWNGKIKLSREAYRRECDMGWSHHTSRSESQQLECEKSPSQTLSYTLRCSSARHNFEWKIELLNLAL